MNTDLVTTVAELRLERRAVAASCARLEALQFVKRAPHTQHCGSGFRAHVRAAVRLKRFERNLLCEKRVRDVYGGASHNVSVSRIRTKCQRNST